MVGQEVGGERVNLEIRVEEQIRSLEKRKKIIEG